MLERFVHLPSVLRGTTRLPEMTAVKLQLPETAQITELGVETEAHLVDLAACRTVGDQWLAAGKALALSVPSAVVPAERNLLPNPLHPQAARIRVLAQDRFQFDPRLTA